MIPKIQKNNAGFTLVELILYIGIASVILLAISLFLATVLESRVKNQTIAEVDQVAAQVIQLITQTIRNSNNIVSPVPGSSQPTLSLGISDPAKNPTTFDLSSNAIRITEGASSPIVLTGPKVIASNLTFQNLARPNTAGIIRIQFTLSFLNPAGKNAYDYTKTFYASASPR